MRLEFLVEDTSGGILISQIIEKYKKEENNSITYNIKTYKGIGNFVKGKNASDVKSQQLLIDLPKRLRALQTLLLNIDDAAVFVILDNDKRDTELFYEQLKEISEKNRISTDHVYCIAVEEMEAWLLGDRNAIIEAYPNFEDRIISKYSGYVQDSICDTWEFLADLLTPRGIKEFYKKYTSVYEIGSKKCEWAEKIGSKLDIRHNNSQSFNRFLSELDKRKG